MTLFKTGSCAACAGLAIIVCFLIAGFTEWAHFMAFLTIDLYGLSVSIQMFWSCPDLTSVTFDMTLARGVIGTPRVTVPLVVTALIKLVNSVFGL